MKYQQATDFEKQLIKLYYCQGIGLQGCWKIIWYWLETKEMRCSLEEMIAIGVLPQHRAVFRRSWEQLTEEHITQKMGEQNYLTFFSAEYPMLLRQIADPPLMLFYEGNLQLLQTTMIGFVGARTASLYARKVCEKLIPPLVTENYKIVSGLANGVDSFAHESAIRNRGKTIAVIASGLDHCYPASAFPLFQQIRQEHLVLSEYSHDTKPQRDHFPLRNRIIAGISKGICVIEAKERSGSLITAQLAMENGREVFAVPGEMISDQSKGCHHLIQDGAKCTISVSDILQELAFF